MRGNITQRGQDIVIDALWSEIKDDPIVKEWIVLLLPKAAPGDDD